MVLGEGITAECSKRKLGREKEGEGKKGKWGCGKGGGREK